jgi:hypothetical protein
MVTLVNSAVETLDRPTAIGSVLASFGMEGLKPDSETAALLSLYAAGSLSLDQFGSAVERHVAQMATGEVVQGAA